MVTAMSLYAELLQAQKDRDAAPIGSTAWYEAVSEINAIIAAMRAEAEIEEAESDD